LAPLLVPKDMVCSCRRRDFVLDNRLAWPSRCRQTETHIWDPAWRNSQRPLRDPRRSTAGSVESGCADAANPRRRSDWQRRLTPGCSGRGTSLRSAARR
jgi:hypothetical protein